MVPTDSSMLYSKVTFEKLSWRSSLHLLLLEFFIFYEIRYINLILDGMMETFRHTWFLLFFIHIFTCFFFFLFLNSFYWYNTCFSGLLCWVKSTYVKMPGTLFGPSKWQCPQFWSFFPTKEELRSKKGGQNLLTAVYCTVCNGKKHMSPLFLIHV